MKLSPFDPANYIETPEDLRYYLEALADPFDPEHYARSIDSVVAAFERCRAKAEELQALLRIEREHRNAPRPF